jgi:hypothetical protein
MRLLEIHTVPLWEEADGTRTLGIARTAEPSSGCRLVQYGVAVDQRRAALVFAHAGRAR